MAMILHIASFLMVVLRLLFFWGLAGLFLFLVRPRSKKGKVLVAVLALVLCGILELFFPPPPIENFLHTFPTPEAVAEYLYPKGEVCFVVEGEHSALVYGSQHNEDYFYITPKADGGYHLAEHPRLGEFRSFTIPWEATAQDGNFYSICLYSVPNCPDRYIYLSGILVNSPDVKVSYPDAEPFSTINRTTPVITANENTYTHSLLTAIAPIKCREDGTCRILIHSGQQSFPIDFDPETDLFMKSISQ